jgi:hypothetical protein
METIRPDSLIAQFYNDGLIIFLYDDQNQDAIKEINPSILEGYGSDDINAELFKVAEQGLLVAYELLQDDEVVIELSIGEPLSDLECQVFRPCLPVRRAYINLPSGKLAIEGYNNLRLSPDCDPDEEPAELFSIPPGEYIVSIYSADGDAQGAEFEEMSKPHHLFVLTPFKQAEPLPDRQPLLQADV